jgi:hypothetical protein
MNREMQREWKSIEVCERSEQGREAVQEWLKAQLNTFLRTEPGDL